MKVSVTELTKKVEDGISKLGYQGEDAEIIKNVLLYAELRGNNQGITKIATGGVPKASDVEEYKVVKQNKCGALVSGGHAMVAADKAAKLATELADEHGVGIVGSNHTFSSSGSIGYFTRQIADAGFIGLLMVGTPPFVAPSGSAEAKLGTNPISYAFPTNDKSVVFDTATAAMAFFGVMEAKLSNIPLPEGVGYDSQGNPTTSAEEALGGSVSTFGAHRGFGLSLLVQILAGPFVDASFINENKDSGAGHFILAIDPGLLADKQDFLNNASKLGQELKSAQPIESGKEVFLPGERGDAIRAEAQANDEIEIADAKWEELCSFVDSD